MSSSAATPGPVARRSQPTNNRHRGGGSGGSGSGGGGRGGGGFFRTLYNFVAAVLKIMLYPIRRLSDFLLPPGEYDGLNDAVTEKAAQHFVNYLKGLGATTAGSSSSSLSPTQLVGIQEGFSTLGFSALRQEAAETHSIILVYLHAPLHRKADETCQKVLLSPPMLEFLSQDKVKALGVSTQTSQGAFLAYQLAATSFPVIALLQPVTKPAATTTTTRTTTTAGNNNSPPVKLVFKAEGPTLTKLSSGHLVSLLTATFQRFQLMVMEQEQRRVEREQEAELRRQQDAEYHEALRADQQREQQQAEERDRQQRLQREEEERERQKVQDEQDRLDRARALIRPEPKKGSGGNDGDATPTRIRFQLPSGQKLERRFWSDETVATLKAFLVLHFADEYKAAAGGSGSDDSHMIKNVALSENFPKKRHEDDGLTLRESGLCPQAVLMVQDLDA